MIKVQLDYEGTRCHELSRASELDPPGDFEASWNAPASEKHWWRRAKQGPWKVIGVLIYADGKLIINYRLRVSVWLSVDDSINLTHIALPAMMEIGG